MAIRTLRQQDWLIPETKALLRLAGPVIVTRSAIVALAVVDLAMVSYVSTRAVGELALAQQGQMFLLMVGLGLLMGTMVVASQAFGAGNYKEAGRAWRRSLPYGFVLGLTGFILCLPSAAFFRFINADPLLVDGASNVLIAYGLGIPGHLIGVCCAFFLEAINRPIAVTITMILANILNLLLNFLLIFGVGKWAGLGAEGAALASSIVRYFIAATLIWIIWTQKDQKMFGVRTRIQGRWSDWREQRRIGYGAGASLGAEVAGFAILGLLAAQLGPLSMAGFGLLFQVQSVFFMLASGLGTAAAVRVGMSNNPHDRSAAVRVSILAMLLIFAIMIIVALFYWSIPAGILGIFTRSTELLAITVPLMVVGGLAVVFDGAQFVLSNALRGFGDTWWPTIIQSLAFLIIMVPVAYWAAHSLDLGVGGLIWGIVAGCVVSVILLNIRLYFLSRSQD